VKVETVIKSFKECGISNAMDGTEDDWFWDTDEEAETDLPDIYEGSKKMYSLFDS
jgi:hypothetical protein